MSVVKRAYGGYLLTAGLVLTIVVTVAGALYSIDYMVAVVKGIHLDTAPDNRQHIDRIILRNMKRDDGKLSEQQLEDRRKAKERLDRSYEQ